MASPARARALALALALLGCGRGESQRELPSSSSSATTIVDLDGHPLDPLADARADLLLFLRTDCPISNRYAPELGRIAARIADAPIDVWIVYVDRDETPALIREHVADYQLPGTPLRDPDQQLVPRAGVHVTPEAALFEADGTRIYRGRIDDWYVDYGKNRTQASTHELLDALAAMLAGRRVAVAQVEAVGCPIPPRS